MRLYERPPTRVASFCLRLLTVSVLPLLFAGAGTSGSTNALEDRYWHAVSAFEGETGLVDVVVGQGEELFFGGHFTRVDGVAISNCARFDGQRWRAVGGAVGTQAMGLVHTIVVDGSDIFVGGMFDQLSGLFAASNIAHWDGSNWNTMNGGTDRAVRNIVRAPNGDIYAGGEFSTAGGVVARGIARWDGSQWHALGEGVNQHVMAIAIHDGDVYVGGRFSAAGGKRIAFLARWDGQEWHPVGTGVNNFVLTMRFRGDELFLGGVFDQAGDVTARGIAMWDGTSFWPLGEGLAGAMPTVRTMLFDGGDIYVGGFFTSAGGEAANYIARWNHDGWSTLGSGLDYTVKSLFKHGHDLYVTGEFTTAGGKPSRYVAKWFRPAVYVEWFEAAVSDGRVRLVWDATVNEPFEGYRIYRRALGQPGEVVVGEPGLLGPSARSFEEPLPPGGHTYEYALAGVLEDGSELPSTVSSVRVDVQALALSQNFPNPFASETTFEFALPSAARVRLGVYDAAGRRVADILDEERPEGPNSVRWPGIDSAGRRVAAGVYFFRLDTPDGSFTRKLNVVR